MSTNQPVSRYLSRPNSNSLPSDDLKFMQWGVSHPQIEKVDIITKQREPYIHENTDFEKKSNNQIIENGNHYHAQYSQVSAIQTGFKKLKTNQIQILKDLKKEYEILRNSSLDSRVFLNKMTSESESNQDSSSYYQSDANSSNHSKQRNHSRQKRNDNRQLRAIQIEKKQLELMVINSMKKIQELLHSQIELKKALYQLNNKIENTKTSQSQYDSLLKKNKEAQQTFQKILDEYRKQNENLRVKVKQLTLTIGTLEGSVNVKDLQLKKKEQKLKLLQEQVQLQHNKYSSLELDLKKVKMQYDILQKSKNEQISLLNRNKNINEQSLISEKNLIIKKLKEELDIKEERYHLLLDKINSNNLSQINPDNGQRELKNGFQKLLVTLKQEKNQQNNESINLILTKVSQLQQKQDNHLLEEINILKRELEAVKNNNLKQTDHKQATYNFQEQRMELSQRINQLQQQNKTYQLRIREHQKAIEEENIEKIYFMEDIKKLTREYNGLKRQKQDLLKQAKDLKYEIQKLQNENRKYKNQIDLIKNVNIDLTQSQHQNKSLMFKLQHMNLREMQINNIRDEFNKKNEEFRVREQNYQQQLRVTKRQLHEQQFKVFKQHEQNELKIKLLKIQYENTINRLQEQLQRAKQNYLLQKNNLINQKIQLQRKNFQKTREIEESSEKVINSLKQKQNSFQKGKSQYQIMLKKQQQRFGAEITNLLAKIQNLTTVNERLIQQSQKYAIIEQQMLELKRLMKINRRITDTVDHLWQVKEAQYANINDILKVFSQH